MPWEYARRWPIGRPRSKKATGKAQQTAAHRRRKTRR